MLLLCLSHPVDAAALQYALRMVVAGWHVLEVTWLEGQRHAITGEHYSVSLDMPCLCAWCSACMLVAQYFMAASTAQYASIWQSVPFITAGSYYTCFLSETHQLPIRPM
jgi:hypothetical protein